MVTLKDIMGIVFWCAVAGFFGYLLLGSPEDREVRALRQSVDSLRYMLEDHDHVSNVEGVWVTDPYTFCEMHTESMKVYADPNEEIPYP